MYFPEAHNKECITETCGYLYCIYENIEKCGLVSKVWQTGFITKNVKLVK